MTVKLNEKIVLIAAPGYIEPALAEAVYSDLMAGHGADLMLESATVDEVDFSYLGDELLYTSHAAMFEAITSERMRLSQTMRAFVRALNRGLNGTNITAGTDDAGTDENGDKSIGGAVIGKVRRVNNIPVMSALIPLSDGQSVSLVFHSPTADNGRIKNSDLLVAFHFLLNKRDVTHIVAPIGGRDVSLQQVSQALANLAERNSAKFAKQQSAQVKLSADIDALNAEIDQLGEQQSTLLGEVETMQGKVIVHHGDAQTLREKLATQRRINAELEAQLQTLQGGKAQPAVEDSGGTIFTDATRTVKNTMSVAGKATLSNGAEIRYSSRDVNGELEGSVIITAPDGSAFEMPSPSSQGGAMGVTATKLLKAYREGRAARFLVAKTETPPAEPAPPEAKPEPEEQPVSPGTSGKFRYALTSRPASIGAVPADHTAILPEPAQGELYGRLARHGFIEYTRRLTEEEAASFELKLIPSAADLDALAKSVADGSMGRYAAQYVEMADTDTKMFEDQVRLTARKAAPNMAYPEGDDLTYFMQAVKTALEAKAQAPAEENDPVKMQNSEAEGYFAGYAFGDREVDSFVSPEADVDTSRKQLLGLANLYALMDNAIAEQTDITLGKTDRETLLGHYLAMSQDAAHQVANWLTSGKTPAGDKITLVPTENPLDASKLIKGEYSQTEIETMLNNLGGTSKPQQQPAVELSDADKAANDALDYLDAVMQLQSKDMAEIREARGKVRAAYAALQEAGRLEENEDRANAAVQHLSELLVAIQREGAAA